MNIPDYQERQPAELWIASKLWAKSNWAALTYFKHNGYLVLQGLVTPKCDKLGELYLGRRATGGSNTNGNANVQFRLPPH